MGKNRNQKINVSKVIILIYFLLAGFFLFSSCKQKQKTNQTSSETQIESIKEEQTKQEVRIDTTKERTFKTEHPILFTIIIIAILLTVIIIFLIIKSIFSDTSDAMDSVSQIVSVGTIGLGILNSVINKFKRN